MNSKTRFEKPAPVESDLQSEVIEHAHRRGWFAVKIVSPSVRGMMDVYCLRRGRHVWMEVKRDGEEERRQQARRIKEMQDQGAEVHVVDTLDQAAEILQ